MLIVFKSLSRFMLSSRQPWGAVSLMAVLFLLTGCFPDLDDPKLQEKLNTVARQMKIGEVERVVGAIELYKLRQGHYPDSITALDLEGAIPVNLASFEYALLDTGYLLNYHDSTWSKFKKIDQGGLILPSDFWKGLGCVRSNLKEVKDGPNTPVSESL